MITGKEIRDKDKRKDIFSVFLIFLTSSLIIGFSDLLISILFTPRFPAVSFSFMFKPLSLTIILFFSLQIILYIIAVLPLVYLFKIKWIDFAVLLSSFFVFFFIIGSVADLFGLSFTPERMFKILIVFVFSIIFSTALLISVKNISEKKKHKRWVTSSALSLPFIFAEILIFFRFVIYGVIPFFTLKFFLTSLLFIFLILFTLWIFNVVFNYKTKSIIVMLFWLTAVFSPVFSPSFPSETGLKLNENFPARDGAPKYIFLVTIDSLRTDSVSCYHSNSELTPNICEFAREAAIFENAFSLSSWTTPSIASLMTGFSPSIHTVTKDHAILPNELPTIAGELIKKGYYTCAFGINPNLTKRTNISRGFLYYDFYPKYAVERAIGSKLLKHFYKFFTAENVFDLAPENVVLDWGSLINTETLTDLCIRWIEENRSRRKRFFLWVHYLDPHVPYAPPPAYVKEKKAISSMGFNFDKAIEVLSGAFVPSEKEKIWMKALYDGEIRYVDDNLGRLFNALKKMDIYNDSLVILTSDHGEEFWDHGRYYHGHSMYNEVLSVPLIIKSPGGKESKRVDTQVSLNHIMPTIFDYCNIPLGKKELYGDSLLPFLNSHTDTGNNSTPQPVVCSGVLYGEKRKALFFDRYKYIISENSQKEELFDLDTDPFERNLLNERMPDRLQEARKTLENVFRVSNKIKQLFKITGDKKSEKDKKESDKLNKLEALGYL